MLGKFFGVTVFLLACSIIGILGGKFQQVHKRNSETQKFVIFDQKVNYFQALVNCHNGGMELASIKSKEENDEMEREIKKNIVTDMEDIKNIVGWENGFWLSGSNLLNMLKTKFNWFPSGAPFTYTNWHLGYPNEALGDGQCVQWSLGKSGHGWNDIKCFLEVRYICKKIEDISDFVNDPEDGSEIKSTNISLGLTVPPLVSQTEEPPVSVSVSAKGTMAKLGQLFNWTQSKISNSVQWALNKLHI